MRALTVIFLMLAFVAAGCEPAEQVERPPDDEVIAPPEAPTGPDLASCENAADGYQVQYPADWQTNPGDVMEPCSLFDPEPIQVQPATEVPTDIAVFIRVEPISFERITEPSPGERALSRSATTVDGRQAERLEVEATGDMMLPEGVRSYRYYVNLNGETLVAVAHDVGEPDYQTKQQVLDDMMQRLRFTGER